MAIQQDPKEITRALLTDGKEHVASFAGRSQYGIGGGGVSACGLAALNCARVILGKEQTGTKDTALVEEMMKQETLEVSCDMLLLG